MRSFRGISWLFVLGLAASTVLPGCGGDDDDSAAAGAAGSGGTAGTGGTAGSSGSSGSSGTAGTGGTAGTAGTAGTGGTAGTAGTGGTAGTAGTAGSAGDGNDTPDTATDLVLAMDNAGELNPPDTDVDFYTFTIGDADVGAPFIVQAFPNATTAFDTTYPDLVLTLYHESDPTTPIAQQDDAIPRFNNTPSIITLLPKAGKYFARVADCSFVFGSTNCADPSTFSNFDYTISGGFLDVTNSSVAFEETDANDTGATATDITAKYTESSTAGSYNLTSIIGKLDSSSNLDYFKIKLPAGATVTAGSGAAVGLYIYPSGSTGNGSTDFAPTYELHDGATDALIASISVTDNDQANRDLTAPVDLDKDYYVVVKAPAGTLGSNAFYVIEELVSGTNPLETADASNGDKAGAETVTASTNDPNTGFFEGTFSTDADVDFYAIDVPSGLTDNTVSVFCGGERSGSGVRGLTATAYGTDGATELTNGTATETATADLTIQAAALAGATKVYIKLNASLPSDTNISSRYYRCGLRFQ